MSLLKILKRVKHHRNGSLTLKNQSSTRWSLAKGHLMKKQLTSYMSKSRVHLQRPKASSSISLSSRPQSSGRELFATISSLGTLIKMVSTKNSHTWLSLTLMTMKSKKEQNTWNLIQLMAKFTQDGKSTRGTSQSQSSTTKMATQSKRRNLTPMMRLFWSHWLSIPLFRE